MVLCNFGLILPYFTILCDEGNAAFIKCYNQLRLLVSGKTPQNLNILNVWKAWQIMLVLINFLINANEILHSELIFKTSVIYVQIQVGVLLTSAMKNGRVENK